MATRYNLKAGHTLTVEAGPRTARAENEAEGTAVTILPGYSRTFGPYAVDRTFVVSNAAAVTSAITGIATSLAGLFMASAGAPVDGVAASAAVNPTGADNGLVFTARVAGAGGNGITIRYVDPGAASQALSVSVVSAAITVSLATNGSSAITSTAAQVKAAVEASALARDLVTVALDGGDDDADDGSGVVTAMPVTALEGGAGTGVGTALPGCICIDTGEGDVYRNAGTAALPAWVKLGDAA